MPSYLGQYPGCSQDRERKFHRAVDSFIVNTYPHKKLIIVSDGCEITEKIYQTEYASNEDIVCLLMDKQVLFSGSTRNTGITYAKLNGEPDDVICYLDTDDRFGPNHLQHVMQYFINDFVIWNCYRISPVGWYVMDVTMQSTYIGTGSFAHKVCLEVEWPDGYGHDWGILDQMNKKYKYAKIPLSEYYIHHVLGLDS